MADQAIECSSLSIEYLYSPCIVVAVAQLNNSLKIYIFAPSRQSVSQSVIPSIHTHQLHFDRCILISS